MNKRDLAHGYFISFEGGEGAGKTTQVQLLCDYLSREGYPVASWREPGGTEIGQSLRDILIQTRESTIEPATEALLMAAARAESVARLYRPALQNNQIVIVDRYLDSSIAFQGGGRSLDVEIIAQINHLATNGLLPDLTILLDIEPSTGLARVAKTRQLDRFEQAGDRFHTAVCQTYRQLADINPERIRIIDAEQSIESIHRQIVSLVADILP